ncbi:hypothetical protein PRIC1_006491 [Phytophthora ramorum]
MWVVDLGTCAIHMDDKPPRFSPPTVPTDRNDSDSAEARPAKKRRVADSSTTCAPEQLHCRYANKKCLNPRAVKRTGGLHTFCAMHRANANRNQRRLDMRKRMARQALRAGSEGDQAPLVPLAVPSTAGDADASPTGGYDPRLEPLHTPTPLLEEDISTLVALFLPSTTTPQHRERATFGYQLAGSAPTTPDGWSSSTSTDGSPPPPPLGGMRF